MYSASAKCIATISKGAIEDNFSSSVQVNSLPVWFPVNATQFLIKNIYNFM